MTNEVRPCDKLLLLLATNSMSSNRAGEGEGDREIEFRVAYWVELAVVSKSLGREYDRVGDIRVGVVFICRKLGLCDVITGWGLVRKNGRMRRRGCSHFFVEEGGYGVAE